MRLSIQTWVAFGVTIIFCGVQSAPITFIAPEQIKAGTYTISTPGFYTLTDDAVCAKEEANAIVIAADHVTLDLNNKVLKTLSGKIGIVVQSGSENISIQNGKIHGFSLHGLEVGAGSHGFSIQNVAISGSESFAGLGTSGISLEGTESLPIYGCTIENCFAHGFERGIYGRYAHEISIANGTCSHNGIGIVAEYADNWLLEKSNASYNVGNRLDVFAAGVVSTACRGWRLQDSEFSFNESKKYNGACYGALFQPASSLGEGESSSHTILSCNFSNNGGECSFARGLDLSLADACLVKDCSFNKNFSTVAAVRGLSISGTGHCIESCRADANWTVAPGYKASGMLIETGSAVSILSCRTSANVSIATGDPDNGIGLGLIGGSRKCFVKNCSTIANALVGFQDNADQGDNLWIGNFAWGHGNSNYIGSMGALSFSAGKYLEKDNLDSRGLDNISIL